MSRFFSRLSYIFLILFIVFLALNELHVIVFSTNLRNVFIYLTLILILLTSLKEIFLGNSGLLKFLNIITLLCTVIGGIFSIVKGQLNAFIYICLLFSLTLGACRAYSTPKCCLHVVLLFSFKISIGESCMLIKSGE